MMDRKEDDLLKNQTLERKALPKRIRQEMKAREQMFRASMRISVTNLNEVMNPTEEKDRLKKVRHVLNSVARWQNLIPSFPWSAPGWRAWGRNPRKGRDQIL